MAKKKKNKKKTFYRENGYYVDENNNKWSVGRYKNISAARSISKTLIDCYNCVDCELCVRCNGCKLCDRCVDCVDCVDCLNLSNHIGTVFFYEKENNSTEFYCKRNFQERVKCLNDGKKFDSIAEASRYYNIKKGTIYNYLHGYQNSIEKNKRNLKFKLI